MVEYIAIQCYSCSMYQSKQQAKVKTFQCKVCGEKQSIKRVYATSSLPKDVRMVVQELNEKRIKGEQENTKIKIQKYKLEQEKNEEDEYENDDNEQIDSITIQPVVSKWKQFEDNETPNEDDDDFYGISKNNNIDNDKFVTSLPENTRKRGRSQGNRSTVVNKENTTKSYKNKTIEPSNTPKFQKSNSKLDITSPLPNSITEKTNKPLSLKPKALIQTKPLDITPPLPNSITGNTNKPLSLKPKALVQTKPLQTTLTTNPQPIQPPTITKESVNSNNINKTSNTSNNNNTIPKPQSKWSNFIDEEEDSDDDFYNIKSNKKLKDNNNESEYIFTTNSNDNYSEYE